MRKQKSPKKPNRFQQIPIGFNQAPLGMLPGSDLPPLPTQSLQGGGWPWPPPTGNPSQWGPWMQGQVDAGTTTGQTYQTLLNSGSPFQGDWLSTVGNFNQGLQNIYSDTATGSHGRKYSAYKTAEDYAHDSLNDNVRRDGYQQAAEYSKLMDEYNTFQTGKKNIGQVSDIMGPTAALFQGMKGEQAYNQKYKPNMTALPGFFGFGRGGLVPGYIKGQIFDTDIPAIPVIRGAKQKNAISANSRRIPSFKKQFGGQSLVNLSGYTPGTPTFNNPVNIIPSGNIDMSQTPFPIMGISDKGTKKLMQPGKQYNFPGAKYVTELPIYQDGGEMIKIKNPLYQDSLNLYNNSVFYDNFLRDQDRLYTKNKKEPVLSKKEYSEITDKFNEYYPERRNEFEKSFNNLLDANGKPPQLVPSKIHSPRNVVENYTPGFKTTAIYSEVYNKPTTPYIEIKKNKVLNKPNYKFQPIPGNPEQSNTPDQTPPERNIEYYNNGEFITKTNQYLSKFPTKKFGGKIKRL